MKTIKKEFPLMVNTLPEGTKPTSNMPTDLDNFYEMAEIKAQMIPLCQNERNLDWALDFSETL